MKWLPTLILMFVVHVSCAQYTITDSIQSALKEKPCLIAGLNNRYSLVSGEPIAINGIQLGADFGGKVKLNLGYNWMPLSQKDFQFVKHNNQIDTILEQNRLSYLGFSIEYIFHHNKKWKFGAPISLGFGRSESIVSHTIGGVPVVERDFAMPLEFGVNGLYYFTDWFGLRGGLGNRLTFGKSFSITSGPYYSLGFSLFIGPLYKKARKLFDRDER